MSETTTTTVAKKPETVLEVINGQGFKLQIAKVLPSILPADRFVRIAVTAMMKTPKLKQCSQASLLNSLLQLAQFGLEPDGRRAHLIPYGDQCQLIVDYKGIVELVLRSGLVSYIHTDVVCENDDFEVNLGEIVKHKIDLKKPRGNMYGVYAICVFKDNTRKAEVMAKDEVEAIRKRSRAGSSGPWVTDFNEMAKKTVFRRLSKWLPLSPEVREVVENDDDVIDIQAKGADVTALNQPINPFEHMMDGATEEKE